MCRSTKHDVSDSPFIRIHKTAGVSFYLKKQPNRRTDLYFIGLVPLLKHMKVA